MLFPNAPPLLFFCPLNLIPWMNVFKGKIVEDVGGKLEKFLLYSENNR
jgi:hypothetical protein